MFADFAVLMADVDVAPDCEALSVVRAFRSEVSHVFAYPQKLAAHALALDDPWEELGPVDCEAAAGSLDLPPPHPAANAATSAKAKRICAIRAVTVKTGGVADEYLPPDCDVASAEGRRARSFAPYFAR
jgi:hypothetical protein